jgi:hypothetical protein
MRLAFLSLLIVLAGCSRHEKFDVSVLNHTNGALTLALTKDGPPFERVWASPEDLAIESPKADEKHGYVVLPAGKSADVSVEGTFDSSTHGYLRVYRGDLQISQMNAINGSSPNRLDIQLRPGVNKFVIGDDREGRLAELPFSALEHPAGGPPPSQTSPAAQP